MSNRAEGCVSTKADAAGVRSRFHTGKSAFRVLAEKTSDMIGSSTAFVVSIVIVTVWACTGFLFHFSDAWQLVINTFTNVLTLFIVFLIQNTQNRDAKAMHLKLDELIRAVRDARTHLVGLENLSDEEMENLGQQFERLKQRELNKLERSAKGS